MVPTLHRLYLQLKYFYQLYIQILSQHTNPIIQQGLQPLTHYQLIHYNLTSNMKAYIFSTLFFLFSFSVQEEITAKVVGISDGDTITVLHEGKEIRIRFNGIDSPEKNQAFGQRAKEFTSSKIFNQQVKLKLKEQDRYGRWIADVFTPSNEWLNLSLIEAGYAWHYKQYSSDPTLAKAELTARQTKAGLWSDPNPTPPWEWRRK